MGFRIVAANGAATFGNPVGIDGVFEASCPPYHPTMDAAVDAVLAPPSRDRRETGPVPHRMSEAEHRAGTIRISTEGLACTKAICNYIHDTYGRFSRRHRCDASDVGNAGPSHRHRLLRPVLLSRRLRAGARGAYGYLAPVRSAPL
jgi:hypothetical protein